LEGKALPFTFDDNTQELIASKTQWLRFWEQVGDGIPWSFIFGL
jgi:hypothetical protein